MIKRHLVLIVSVALLLSACIPSVNPFYTEKDLVFDPRLTGEWRGKDEADMLETWKFEADGRTGYKLTVTEKDGKHGEFEVRLFKLKKELFLDLIPMNCDYAADQSDLVAASMFPGHLMVRVTQIEPELRLAFADFKWLGDYLERDRKALAHRKYGDDILLTATTKELQSFALKHLAEDELFDNGDAMVRK